jgi:hypothetical protein
VSAALSWSIGSEAYVAGHGCDGHPVHGEALFVICENERGDRWRHHMNCLCLTPLGRDEDGYASFADTRADAERESNYYLELWGQPGTTEERVRSSIWFSSTRPVYGSAAYSEYGQDDDIATERKEDDLF